MALRALRRKQSPRRSAQATPAAPGALPAGAAEPPRLPAEESQFGAKAMAQIEENRHAQASAEQEALLSLKLIPTTRKAEVFKKFIAEEAKKDPGRVAQLLRSWLNGEAA